MISRRYLLLLNDTLKGHIVTLSKGQKRRLREKFEYLENGIWDTGLKVKKLKGISQKVIFEARVSKGDRIIFTLGKYGALIAIYIWGIVKHDDINKAFLSILPHNAPFLNFEPEYQREYPEMIIDELDETNFTQEAIDQKTSENYGPQKWLVLGDEEWKRLLLSSDPENFNIHLYLSAEQEAVLKKDPPLLLSGTAGSGKTTISVYYLLKDKLQNKKCLFLTYSPYLKDFSERIYSGLIAKSSIEYTRPHFYTFHGLLKDILVRSGMEFPLNKEAGLREFLNIFRNHKLAQKYDGELVWEEIRAIIKGAKPPFSLQKCKLLLKSYTGQGELHIKELKNYLYALKNLEFIEKIERLIQKKSLYNSYDEFIQALSMNSPSQDAHIQILNEIQRLIEKRVKNITEPLLSYQEYLLLGKKRAPNFLYNREDIYSIAQYYQEKIEELGMYDEIDLCRSALQHLDRTGDAFSYDFIVCDEVQDYSDVQIALIFRLAKNYQDILFTGDPKQIINPSGFRWEEVKNKFYERGIQVPDVYKLNLNFRCVGNIVKLSNALLDLKQRLIGLTGSEQKEDWKFNGRPPYLIHGIEEEKTLGQMQLIGAGQIILVRDKNEQKRLKKTLKTELVFTINEAKGLEFDTVFLWKFILDKKSADLWRKIKDNQSLDQSHCPHIRHEINLLYVAITRARNTFIVYDGKTPSNIWGLDIFNDLLYKTGDETVLHQIWQRVSTPKEWEKQGDYFFERRFYSAATECYKNAGNLPKSEISQAHDHEQKKRYRHAARLFAKHRIYIKAAENYENAGEYQEAIPLWKKAKKPKNLQNCMIKMYEQNGSFNKAAGEWLKLKNTEMAIKDFIKAGNHLKAAGLYHAKRQYKIAGEHYEKGGDFGLAAVCYEKIKAIDKAANLYYKAGALQKAAKFYKKLKNHNMLIRCYSGLKDYYNCALIYERQKKYDYAIKHFSIFAENNHAVLLKEAKEMEKKHRLTKAAIRYAALGNFKLSSPILFNKKQYELALTGFKAINAHEEAAACYRKMKQHYEAALEYEKSQTRSKWQHTQDALRQYLRENPLQRGKRADKLYAEGESMKKAGAYEKALARFMAINHTEGIKSIYFDHLERHEEAISYFLNHNHPQTALEYLNTKNVAPSKAFLKEIIRRFSYYIWHEEKTKHAFYKTICKTFIDLYGNEPESIIFLDDALISFPVQCYDENLSPINAFCDLILEVKSYNSILFILIINHRDKPTKGLKDFLQKIKEKAEAEQDRSLLACYNFIYDTEKFEELIKDTALTERNFKLFENSTSSYTRVAEYYRENHHTDTAIKVYKRHNDLFPAAKLYEEKKQYRTAANTYLKSNHYNEALRCYKKIDHDAGIARVYEKAGEYDMAMELWNKLGKTKEYERARRKKINATCHHEQLSLFPRRDV